MHALVAGNTYEWSTGETSNCITVDMPGIYSVTVTDPNGCFSVCSEEIILNPLPQCTITGDFSLCEGESSELCTPLVAGNTYEWSTGETSNCITVDMPGIYSVTVTDQEGCFSVCSEEVVLNPLPVCTITGDFSICEGESSELCTPLVVGNTYEWSTGETSNCITVDMPGIYSVTVTDPNGCFSVCSEEIILNPLPQCTITGDFSLCEGESSELCTPFVTGYTYEWSTGETSNCVTVSMAGIYSVTVTDPNGCFSVCSEEVTLNPLPICTITGDFSICEGESSELCTPLVAGNTYEWSTGETSNCITVDMPGIYSVTVTDPNGCFSVCSEEVVLNPLPVCIITGDDLICKEGESAELCVPAGYAEYLWSTGETTNCITANAIGTYSVTLTDANGCSSSCSKDISINPEPICTITGGLICDGQPIELCVPAGTSSYVWSTGETTNCITVSAAGAYSVTVTYANGCFNTCSTEVTVDITPPEITCPADVTIDCEESTLPLDTGTATATDNCTLSPVIDFNDIITEGTCPQEYAIMRTWTATDGDGNSSTCIQTLLIEDNTTPSITCPAVSGPVECVGQIPAADITLVVASDNCGPTTVTHVGDGITGEPCEDLTLTRTYQATDLCGNVATCTQVITVIDDTPPEITFTNPLLGQNGDTIYVQCYGQDPDWDLPSFDEGSVNATDNCADDVVVTFGQVLEAEGNCREDGYINLLRLSWTATDVCGNSSNAFLFLVMIDTIPPVIHGVPNDTIVNCDEIPELPILIYATDECLCACVVLLEETYSDMGCQDGQVLVRTWIAKDDCGNETIETQNITLIDSEAPVLIGVPDVICIGDPALSAVSATDNCGQPSLQFVDVNIPNPCGSGMVVQRVYEAYDNCGNMSRDTAILLPNNQNEPRIEFVNPVLAALEPGEVPVMDCAAQNGQYTSFGIDDVRVEDACMTGGAVFFTERIIETRDCSNGEIVAVLELKWTVLDACGNLGERTLIVHLTDESSPAFVNFAPEVSIGCNDELPVLSATDDCGEVYITTQDSIIPGDCVFRYDIQRLATATDQCGNTTTRLQTIHVGDESGPIIAGVQAEVCDDLSCL
ncbi:MAG: hypothetical protein H6573_08600 [Lewinellaceae bacterium]|nr:hypothetical protein [Lewinellaceae bacterium]